MPVDARLASLAREYALPDGTAARLGVLLRELEASPHALSAVTAPTRAVEVHVADSLNGLRVPELATATRIADLGSGGGFPGLVVAATLPGASVTLVESVGKKTAHLEGAALAMGLTNVTVVTGRAEAWPAGLGAHDAVTARALAALDVLLEYAAPLLTAGGALIAWKGHRDGSEEAAASRAAAELGMTAPAPTAVRGPEGAVRHLYVSLKVAPTPSRFPRKPGIARKRPLGGSTSA